jgi:uncharacterized protein YdeI (YjbR/CyaY-like superfamily)
MGALDRAPHVQLEDRHDWRRWLEDKHATAAGVWLVSWRPSSGRGGIAYNDSVEEALCFGWIDGQAAVVDELRSRQYFAPRRPGSPWSSSNKERVERLTRAGLMAPAGLAAVERAKADGSWTILDAANSLELPADLAAALDARPSARANWEAFTPSVRRALLGWIALAKRDETRVRRIEKTADAAQRNERAVG